MIAQGTDEWFAQRLGRATASRVSDIIAKTKSGYSASRENYMVELALERLTGRRTESYTNAAMQWGTETEPLARSAYEASTGVLVAEVGMIPHPRIEMSGASPDGLVGEDGLIEIKCPNSATHMQALRSKVPAGNHATQMQWQMACTGRAWCDYVSFDPRMPEGLDLFVVRVLRDDAVIAGLEREVERFLEGVAAMVRELHEMQASSLKATMQVPGLLAVESTSVAARG